MFSKRTTLLSVLGLAALATWLKLKRGHNTDSAFAVENVENEDDRLADIIRTARPALERAMQPAG